MRNTRKFILKDMDVYYLFTIDPVDILQILMNCL